MADESPNADPLVALGERAALAQTDLARTARVYPFVLPLLLFAAGVLLSAIIFRGLHKKAETRAKARFKLRTNDVAEQLRHAFRRWCA